MIDRCEFYEQRAAFRERESGCGLGDLLAAVKPAQGVGVDFSPAMISRAQQRHPELEFHVAEASAFTSSEKFDYLLLSDLVNDVPDVQEVFENLQSVAHD